MSRRELAKYAIVQLEGGSAAKPLARRLAAALIDAGKDKEADLLISDILAEFERRGRLARVELATAHALSAQLTKALSDFAKDMTKVKEVLITSQVEPDLLGGFRIQTASRTWDQTIKRRLSDIKGGINA